MDNPGDFIFSSEIKFFLTVIELCDFLPQKKYKQTNKLRRKREQAKLEEQYKNEI